jgi:hypothetical protein
MSVNPSFSRSESEGHARLGALDLSPDPRVATRPPTHPNQPEIISKMISVINPTTFSPKEVPLDGTHQKFQPARTA